MVPLVDYLCDYDSGSGMKRELSSWPGGIYDDANFFTEVLCLALNSLLFIDSIPSSAYYL